MVHRVTIVLIFMVAAAGIVYCSDPLAEMGIPYLYKDASINGEVNDTVAEYVLTCDLEVFEDEEVKFPLFKASVALTDCRVTRGDEDDILFVGEKEGVSIISRDNGRYSIEVKYVVRVDENDGCFSTVMPLVESVKSSVEFLIPGTGMQLSSEKGAGLKTEQTAGGLKARIFAPGRDSIPLIWKKEKKRDETIETMATCSELIRVYLGRAGVQVASVLQYNIVQGKLDTVEVGLEKGFNLLDVKGERISFWKISENEGQRNLEIVFSQPVSGRITLSVVGEKGIEKVPSSIDIPFVVPGNITKVSGYLATFLEKGLQVDVDRTSDIRQIDVSTLPPELRKGDAAPNLGFRFIQEHFGLSVKVSEIEPRVFVSAFTRARMGRQNIKSTTNLNFDIKNAGVFGFSIKLPKELKLLDISGRDINSWNVSENRIKVDLRSRAVGDYSLELLTDYRTRKRGEVDFPVVSVEDVESERGYIEIEPAKGMKVRSVTLESCNQIDKVELPDEFTQFLSGNANSLVFRYISHPFRLVTGVDNIQPEISARVSSLIKIEERGLEAVYEVRFSVEKAGVYNLEMQMSPDLDVVDVKGTNIDLWKREGGTLKVVLKKKMKGEYTLVVSCQQLLTELIPSITVPSFSVKNVKKEKGTVGIAVNVPVKILENPSGMKDIREVELKTVNRDLRAAGIVRAYRYFKQPWELRLKTRTIHPRIRARVFNFISVGRPGAAAAVTFEYTIRDAETSEFELEFPNDAQDISIKGPDAKPAEKTGENVFRVVTHSGRIGTYSLFANFRVPLAKNGSLTYSGVQAKGVSEQKGFCVVSASDEMEINPADMQNLVPVDYSDIDNTFKVGITDPVLMAFRYLEKDYKMELNTVAHPPAEVVVAVIEAAKAYSTVSPNGSMMTDVFFKLRNTTEQFLRLKMPEGSEILHLVVNNREISPKKGGGETLIPVSGIGGRPQEYKIYLRYKTGIEKLGYSGSITFPFPGTKVKILQLGWTMDFPEKYRVRSGDCENIEPVDRFTGLLRNIKTVYKAQSTAGTSETQQQQMSYQEKANKDAQYWNYMTSRKKGERSIYTGSMPSAGHRRYFMSLFPMENSVSVEISYIRRSMGTVWVILLSAAVLFITVMFYRYVNVSMKIKTAAVLLGVAVFVMIMVGSESVNMFLAGAAIALPAGGIIGGLWVLMGGTGYTVNEAPAEDTETPEAEVTEDSSEKEESPRQDEPEDDDAGPEENSGEEDGQEN